MTFWVLASSGSLKFKRLCLKPRQEVQLITFLSKRAAALHTAKTLRVPVFIQSRDHFLKKTKGRLKWHDAYVLGGSRRVYVSVSHVKDGLVAVGAVRREQSEVVGLAVRPPVLLEEVAAAQLRLALCAHKVLRVPHLPQSRDHLHRSQTMSWKQHKKSCFSTLKTIA